MQFSSVAMQDQPFFAQKAIDPAAASAKQGRAELTAGLLQRVTTEASVAAAAQQRQDTVAAPVGQWIAPSRLYGESHLYGEQRLYGETHDEAGGPTIAALLRAAGTPHRPAVSSVTASAPAGRRRPVLSNKLQKLARSLSDDDLAVAVGQVKVLAKARRRVA
jgi:hypothetical protein